MTKLWLIFIVIGTSFTCYYILSNLVPESNQSDAPTFNRSTTAPNGKTDSPPRMPRLDGLEIQSKAMSRDTDLARKNDALDRKNRLAGAKIAQAMLKDEFLDGYVSRTQKLFEPLYAEWQTDEATIDKIGEALRESRVKNQTARIDTTLTGREQNQYLSEIRSQTATELSLLIGKQKAEQLMKMEAEAAQKKWKSAIQELKNENQ